MAELWLDQGVILCAVWRSSRAFQVNERGKDKMSETLNAPTRAPPKANDQDAIELSPVFEGPEPWLDYSVTRGNESSVIASLPYGRAGGIGRDYAQASWNSHGLWLG